MTRIYVEGEIQFRCDCGATIRVPDSAAGRIGTCNQCGSRVRVPTQVAASTQRDTRASAESNLSHDLQTAGHDVRYPRGMGPNASRTSIPGRPASAARTGDHESPQAPAVEQICSVCQTVVQADEATTICSECGLPFHVECWEENLGCSAYGCVNVNALRSGADISIDHPPPLPSPAQRLRGNVAPVPNDDMPWEYVILAASAVGTLVGLLCFGVLSLFAGVAAVLYFVFSADGTPSPAIVACLITSFIGFIFGLVVSCNYWW